MGCRRRFGGFAQCFMCLDTCVLLTGLLLSVMMMRRKRSRTSILAGFRRLVNRGSYSKRLPGVDIFPHIFAPSSWVDQELLGRNRFLQLFRLGIHFLRRQFWLEDRRYWLILRIKNSGTPRGAIVAKILWQKLFISFSYRIGPGSGSVAEELDLRNKSRNLGISIDTQC